MIEKHQRSASASDQRRKLRELLSAVCDEGPRSETIDQIERLLGQHPHLVAEYADFVTTESLIESSCGLTFLDAVGQTATLPEEGPVEAEQPKKPIDAAPRDIAATPSRLSNLTRSVQEASRRTASFALQHGGWVLAACLLIALTGGVAWWTTPPIATVVSTHEATVTGAQGIMPGDTLDDEWYELESGSLRLAMRNGVMASIDAPARFRPRGDNAAELKYGTARLHVPDAGHGFRLIGRSATLVDLGTGFSVAAGLEGGLSVHVTQGKIRVEPAADAATDLEAGRLAEVDPAGSVSDASAKLQPKTFGQMRFINEHPESLRLGHYRQDSAISVFLESHAIRLPHNLRLDNSKTGVHTRHGDSRASLKAGTMVHCYLLHSSPKSERHEARGKVRFNGRIVGVLCEDDRLNATNELLGARWTLACDHPERGAESAPDPNFDLIAISPDRRELSAHFRTMSIDQVRVLVEAEL